nr:tyrosine-type recombinase/integrase [Allobranchiibius huperziae]
MALLSAREFAAWLTDRDYAPATVADARRTASAYLADRPRIDQLTGTGIAEWIAGQPVGEQRRTRYRTHLHRLSDYARATLPAEQLAALEDLTNPQARTLEDFLRWLRVTGAAPSTVKNRRSVVSAFLVDHPEFLTCTEEGIEAWLDGQRLSRTTRGNYRGHLRSLYRWADLENLSPSTHLTPRSGPGTATSVTAYGRGLVLVAVPAAWQRHVEAWIDWQSSAGRPDTTLYLREYHLRRFAAENLHLEPLAVTVDDLAAWLAAQNWAIETRRSYRTSLRSFYGWAHRTGRMDNDPSAQLPSIRPPRAVAKPAPHEVIIDALSRSDERTGLMIRLGAELGLRRGEIARAHTRDLTRDHAGHLSLTIAGKGGHQRRIPVTGDLARRLTEAAVYAGDAYLFPGNDDGHLSPAHVGKILSRVLDGRFTGHALRHRFATAVYAPTRDLFTTQTLLGHADPRTTRRYVELPPEALRRATASAAL